MSKRETPPSPFSEATVVQTRTPSPAPTPVEHSNDSGAGEKTVVHARSNLKATFDERTVVRPSNGSFPSDMPPVPKAEAPKIPDVPKAADVPKKAEAPKAEPAIASFAVGTVSTSAAPSPSATPVVTPSSYSDSTGGAVQLKTAEADEQPVKKSKKEKAPREPRKPLDQRTKLFIAGGAATAILAVIFMMSGGDSTEPTPAPQHASAEHAQGEESMASQEQPQAGAPKFQQLPGPPASTTTDVLNRFDRAALRAQERAEQYSRSGGGF